MNPGPVIFSKFTLHKLHWLEWVAIPLSFWFLIHPKPYEFLLGVLLVIPVIGMLLNGLNRPGIVSLVETRDENGEEKYDVADFIDIPAWVIVLRVFLDYEFESYYSMIIPGTIACIIILAILFSTHKLIENSARNKWWIYSSLIFNACLYSYGGTYAANCAYDYSKPEIYEAEVVSKRISRARKNTTWYIEVTPWGNHRESEEIKVSGSKYYNILVGHKVNIELKKGLFGIPWYYLEKNRHKNVDYLND